MYNSATKSMMWVGGLILTAGAYMVLGLYVAVLVGGVSFWWLLKQD